MNHHNHIGRESRLLHYVKPTEQTRFNSRNAQINAENQTAQRQAQVSLNQSTGQTTSSPNFQTAETVPKQDLNQQGFQTYTPDRNEFGVDMGGTTVVADQLGGLDQGALQRLMDSGMSEGQARERITSLKPSIAGTMSNTGLGSTARITPQQSLQQQRDAELGTIPTTIQIVVGTNEDGSPRYQTIANPNLASDQAKIKNRFAQEDLTKSTNQATETRNVQSRTAGDAATQKSQTPPKLPEAQKSAPQVVPDEVKIEEYGTMIDGAIAASGDPLGPMIKGMMMMEYRNSLTKEANALTALDSAIKGAGAADDAFQKTNDRYLEIHRQENGKLTNLLTETRDSTEKYLDEQKERDLARLTWEQDSQTRKLDKQKTDQMLSKEIQLSLTGGAFSGAANDRLDATEREWDVAIADLGKEYSFKKADQSAFYTQKYVETQNQFRMDIFNAAKSLSSTIEGYEIKGFNSLAAKGNAITGAKKDYNDTLTKLSDDRVTSMKGMVKEMRETAKDTRDSNAKIAERRETMAKALFFDAFNNSTDTAYRQSAVDMMKKAGYDLGNVDVNNLTLDQQLKIVDMQKKRSEMNATNPYNYTDPVESEIMNAAALAVGNAPGDSDHKQFLLGKVAKFVQAGDDKGANDFINSIAASGLGEEQRGKYARAKTMIGIAASASETLTDMAENGGSRNIYAMTWNKAKNLAAFSQSADFIALSTEIAQLSAEELSAKSGAAISVEEFARLKEYVPQANDTVKDALNKMKQFSNVLKAKNQDILDIAAGRLGTDNYKREKANSDTNASPYSNDYFEDFLNLGTGAGSTPLNTGGGAEFSYYSLGRETQGFNTAIASRANGGLYEESTVKAWKGTHAGVDIAIPQGTNLPSKVRGEVIEVGYSGGWGGTILIRDTNGGEHRFSHLSNLGVKKGDKISSGQIIAKTGGAKGTKGAGNSTGAHLDYRIWKDGKYVDPNTYQYSS